jgi:hypothetical protein
MTNGNDLPIPDLPTPITTPDPTEVDPSQLPVEPELDPASPTRPLGVSSFAEQSGICIPKGLVHSEVALSFRANRQFMPAAAFRWPHATASVTSH